MPVGTVLYFAASTPPDGFLECDGSVVSSATYPSLTALLGTTYGAYGQLPDLRGEFVRGWIHGRSGITGESGTRLFGTIQLDALQDHDHFGAWFGKDTTGYRDTTEGVGSPTNGWTSKASEIGNGLHNPRARTSEETRPRNVAMLPCIRALP
ncbi:phage tail protein [Anaeromusa acidaminophila]|uniref:phage tail protein n=1 Tax=Anaeromusa acidaminophila TaxID=81464 RepID=UPI0008FC16CE|nr:phage tail protein [Anaeromusa acidaminophila]